MQVVTFSIRWNMKSLQNARTSTCLAKRKSEKIPIITLAYESKIIGSSMGSSTILYILWKEEDSWK